MTPEPKMMMTEYVLRRAKPDWIGFFKHGEYGIELVTFENNITEKPGFYFIAVDQMVLGFTYVGNTRSKGGVKRFVCNIRNRSTDPTAAMQSIITRSIQYSKMYYVPIENMKYLLNLGYGDFRQMFNKTPKSEGQSLEEIKQTLHDLYSFRSQKSRQ